MVPVLFLAAGGLAYLGRKAYKRRAAGKKAKRIPAVRQEEVKQDQKEEEIEAEQEINHYLSVSAGALGLAAAGSWFFPPLSIISIPINLYVSWPVFERTCRTVAKERKAKAELIDSIAILASLAAGYYTIAAFSNCIYFTSEKILSKTRDCTKKKIGNLFFEQPRHVWAVKDGAEVEMPFAELCAGDVIAVRAGEVLPADGVVLEGAATVDEHLLTGEARPCEKTVGEQVFAATVVLSGRLLIKAAKTGTETIAAQIGEIFNNTAAFELAMQTRNQQLADKSVVPTLMLSGLALATLGKFRAMAVICANFSEVGRIAGPLGMLNFLGAASKEGILIKDGRVLELLHQVDAVVFDKTGTLTLNQFALTAVVPLAGMNEEEVLRYAATAERGQQHPVARTILAAAQERKIELFEIDANHYEVGHGIKVEVSGKTVRVGSCRFMEVQAIAVPESVAALQLRSHSQGCSTVFVAIDDQLAGMLELRPQLRPEAKEIVRKLQQRNLAVSIISGDQENPTKELAAELGIDSYAANVLPHEKSELIERLQQEGKTVCFVGDGINDSIALKKANVSISLSGAAAAATDTAQIIFADQSIAQLDRLFALANEYAANQKTSVAAVFVPGIVCVGGIFFLHFGILSSMVFYNVSAAAGIGNAMLPLLKR